MTYNTMTHKQILNINQLMYWLTTPVDTLYKQFNKYTRESEHTYKRHIFVDMGSPILYVVHMDTVLELYDPKDIFITKSQIHATGLDDRLGCYIAFRLNLLGIKGDILICDNEEMLLSTSIYFKTKKHYNWVIEFDKGDSPVATYGNHSKVFLDALKEYFIIGKGTYTDISDLYLPNNPCMFNLGIGYYNPHKLNSYLDIYEFVSNVNTFKDFYNKYKNTYFPID